MQTREQSHSRVMIVLVLLLAYAMLVSLYWIVRYAGWSMEGDATRLTLSAEGIFVEGTIIPHRWAYQSGYGYPAQLAFLSNLTGVSVQEIQLKVSIWLIVLSLTAFICYRELLDQAPMALLATFLLLLQPDFLFYILRASHEKTTWLYTFLLLFLLARSYRFMNDLFRLASYVILFYIVFWAMVTSNAFFASTILVALAFCFVGGWVLTGWNRQRATQRVERRQAIQRFLIISLASFAIVFTFITYIYSPAVMYYRDVPTLIDRLSLLFLNAKPIQQPYSYIETAWRRSEFYLMLTGAQWLIVICSAGAWVLQALCLVRQGPDALSRKEWLLWLMYGGFAVQLVFSVVIDFSGFMSANLQVRLFPPFTLMASPLAAHLISKGYRRLNVRWHPVTRSIAMVLVIYAATASLLKITNDPVVGNQWCFYSPTELGAEEWVDRHLQYRQIWVDTFSHQVDVLEFWKGYTWRPTNDYEVGISESSAPYVLISRLTRLQASRSALSLPSTVNHNRVYDNGDVQLYHRRPRSPYQP